MRARTQFQEEKGFILHKIKQTNKNYPIGEKQTGWTGQGRTGLDWTGLDWTGLDMYDDESTYGNEPTRNCKHKEIIKGANEEGNEGEQLRKINQ